MGKSGKKTLDEQIEEFCSSTAELISGIQAKYCANEKSGSKKKRKKKRKEIIPDPDIDDEYYDGDPFSGI